MPIQRRLPLLAICAFAVAVLVSPLAIGQEPAPAVSAPAAPEPLALEQAVATALALNPRIHEAEQNLAAARATVTQARAGRSPTADVQVTRTRISDVAQFPMPVIGPSGGLEFKTVSLARKEQTQGTLTVIQPLYTGGRIPALIRQSKAGVSGSEEGLARTQQTIVNDVKQAYYGVLVAADFVRVADDALASAREHLRVAQARYDAGVAPRFDVLRAETRVADGEQSLIQARNGLDLARAALNNAMGVPQDRGFELTTPFVQPPVAAGALSELIAQAEQSRPELGQIQAQIGASGAAADVARSDKYPTLGLAWVSNRVLDATAFQVSNWTLSLAARMTVFNGKQTSAAVSRARHEQESARALLEQVRQGVALQVRQAYLALNSASERITAAAKGVEQAQEALRIANVRYQAGVSISVEVIDAEVALATARNQYAQAVYDYSVALAALEYAVGASPTAAEPAAQPPAAPVETPAQ